VLKTTDAALLMGNIQSPSFTLRNSLSPSPAILHEGKISTTDVGKTAPCSSKVSDILNPMCQLTHAYGCRGAI